MAPQNIFLFVNKDSSSPSLSRNTGREAAIASRINKHVQQQRFRKTSGSRKNWFRPFNRSDSSGPSTPSSVATCFDVADGILENNSQGITNTLPVKKPRSGVKVPKTEPTPRSIPDVPLIDKVEIVDEGSKDIPLFSIQSIISRPGDSVDPFSNTVQAITPALREVLTRHLHWAVSSSISEYTIHEGIRRILSTIMTDRMHSTAFLAMATAQQRRTAKVTLPQYESAEFYSYKATKLIREHIEADHNAVDRYTFVDVFRLAMSEWLNGNHKAARLHFSYVAQVWPTFKPLDWGEQHNLEVISSEDIFLAIDIDQAPMLELNWEPELQAIPDQSSYPDIDVKLEMRQTHLTQIGQSVRDMLATRDSSLRSILSLCCNDLFSTSDYSKADFASALTGSLWVIKRRMHANLHRLQSLSGHRSSAMEEVLRRTLIILLFLASTTPARRLARTDFLQLASRLRSVMVIARKGDNDIAYASCDFWLWTSLAGLVATREAISLDDQYSDHSEELKHWFLARCMQFARSLPIPTISPNTIRSALQRHIYFESVHDAAVIELVTATRKSKGLNSIAFPS